MAIVGTTKNHVTSGILRHKSTENFFFQNIFLRISDIGVAISYLVLTCGGLYIHTYIHNLYLTWEKRLAIAILQVFHKLILRKKEICT